MRPGRGRRPGWPWPPWWASAMGAVFLTSSTTAVLAHAVLPGEVRAGVGWVGWAVCAAPANVLLLAGMLAALVWLYRPRPGELAPRGPRSGVLAMQRALLGRPSRAERACLATGAGLLVSFATQPLHGIDPAWLAVLALALLGAVGLVTADTLRGVNWSFALFFGMLASLPDVLGATGADRWLAGLVGEVTGGFAGARVTFIGGLAVLGALASLVLRWQAAAPILTIAASPVAQAAGISPLVVAVVATIACNGFVAPYQSTTYLALYHGTGGGCPTIGSPARPPWPTGRRACSRSAPACRSGAGWACSSRAVRERPRPAGRSPADARRGGVDDEAPHGRVEVPAESPGELVENGLGQAGALSPAGSPRRGTRTGSRDG